jgi:hypothetical protein
MTKRINHIAFRICLLGLLIFSCTLPLFKRETSDFDLLEKGISGVAEQISEKGWGIVGDAMSAIKDKLFEDEVVRPPSRFERWEERLLTGYGYGFSAIGAANKFTHDSRFGEFSTIAFISFLQLALVVMITLTLFIRAIQQLRGFLSLLLLLAIIYQFGELTATVDYASITWGMTLFGFTPLLIIVIEALRLKENSKLSETLN